MSSQSEQLKRLVVASWTDRLTRSLASARRCLCE